MLYFTNLIVISRVSFASFLRRCNLFKVEFIEITSECRPVSDATNDFVDIYQEQMESALNQSLAIYKARHVRLNHSMNQAPVARNTSGQLHVRREHV